jgi:hypothetical protein
METIIPGLNVEILENGTIVTYTLSSAQTTTVSAWSDLAITNLKQWPKDRPYLALHDLSSPGVGLLYLTAVEFDPFNPGVTPGGRRAFQDLIVANPDWPVVLALVVSSSMSGRLTRLRISEVVGGMSRITSRAFFKREVALEWLKQYAGKTPKTAVDLDGNTR